MSHPIRDAYAAAYSKPKQEAVELPEIGQPIYVTAMTAREMLVYYRWLNRQKPGDEAAEFEATARLVVGTCRDADGQLVFTRDDIALLADADFDALRRLGEVAQRVCGMNGGEKAVKNSDATTASA